MKVELYVSPFESIQPVSGRARYVLFWPSLGASLGDGGAGGCGHAGDASEDFNACLPMTPPSRPEMTAIRIPHSTR